MKSHIKNAVIKLYRIVACLALIMVVFVYTDRLYDTAELAGNDEYSTLKIVAHSVEQEKTSCAEKTQKLADNGYKCAAYNDGNMICTASARIEHFTEINDHNFYVKLTESSSEDNKCKTDFAVHVLSTII